MFFTRSCKQRNIKTSLDAVKFISQQLKDMFNLDYNAKDMISFITVTELKQDSKVSWNYLLNL